MNIRIIFLVLMTSMIGVSLSAKRNKSRSSCSSGHCSLPQQTKADEPTKLQAKPIVFFNVGLNNAKEKCGKLLEETDPTTLTNIADRLKIYIEESVRYPMLKSMAQSVAKDLGAGAVIFYLSGANEEVIPSVEHFIHIDSDLDIDPACDITQEAIDRFKKFYLAEEKA